ncbi:MAG: M48 family metallopeptidase [Bacteroidales bacterium]|jgi:predicted metal-dependent hydrolase|nr:M48 family metallopeptidase [Bacteroidales bacterium]
MPFFNKSTSQTIHFPQIGEVLFVFSPKSRSIRISLRPFGGIKVSVPRRVPVKQAINFVEQKADWILKAKEKIEQQERKSTIFTPDTVFYTSQLQLQLLPWKSEKFRVHATKHHLQIFYPQEIDLSSDKSQEIIKKYITERIRKEAKEFLPERTEQLARKCGFSYNSVTVKNVSSRWGSCSASNHINLNIHLMRLPLHLRDYVIVHELAHTIHKNHGVNFWKCLDNHTEGKAKQLAAEMRHYHAKWF